MLYYLTARDGSIFYLLPNKSYTVGQKEGDLVTNDDAVSCKHAEFTVKMNEVCVVDCGSTYGTFINGTKLENKKSVQVHGGSMIKFGVLTSVYKLNEMPIMVTTCGIGNDQKHKLNNNINAIGGLLVENWTDECTHVSVNEISLTVKILSAVISGMPIVKLNYWDNFVECINDNKPIPNISKYTPKCSDSILNENFNFEYKEERRQLFTDKIFVFPLKNDTAKMASLIKAAGGESRSWEEYPFSMETIDEQTLKKYIIVETGDTNKMDQSLQIFISKYTETGQRTIPLQEILLAIINCSCEKDCNPMFNRNSLVFGTSSSNLQQNVDEKVLAMPTPSLDVCGMSEEARTEFITETCDITTKVEIIEEPLFKVKEEFNDYFESFEMIDVPCSLKQDSDSGYDYYTAKKATVEDSLIRDFSKPLQPSSKESAENVNEYSPPRKRQKRTALSSSEKNMIINSYKIELESNPKLTLREIAAKTAIREGVCDRTVYRVLKEYKTNNHTSSPKKEKVRKKLLENIVDFERSVIRRKVHEFYFRNELPTINKILQSVNDDPDLPNFKRTTFYKLLKELKFKQVRKGRDSALVERDEIIQWRRKYLRTIKEYRLEQRKIYYLGETWLNQEYSKDYVWKDETVKSTGKGTRFIIVHIGSDIGFVDGGLWVFESNSADYHQEVNATAFEEWFNNILNELEENAIIVMDNAAHHSRKQENCPTIVWKKENIRQWLRDKNITFDQESLKKELLDKVRQHKSRYNKYVVDELAKAKSKTVLRLPPQHCELNPIEKIWADVKQYVASENKIFKMPDIKTLFNKAVAQITTEKWMKCIRYVIEKEERRFWELDNIIETLIEPLIINCNDDSSETDWDLLE